MMFGRRAASACVCFLIFFISTDALVPFYNASLLFSFSSPWIRQDFLTTTEITGPDGPPVVGIPVTNLTLRSNGTDVPLYFYALNTGYFTEDNQGNILRELIAYSATVDIYTETLPDNNVVQTVSYGGSIGGICQATVYFQIFENAEDIPYAKTFIPIAEGGWKLSFDFINCSFAPEEAFFLFHIDLFLEGDAMNYTMFTDSRGSFTRLSWFYDDNGVIRRWNWNWPQVMIADNEVINVFLKFATNTTTETSYVEWITPTFTSAHYDPDIGIVLEPTDDLIGTDNTNVVAIAVSISVGGALIVFVIVIVLATLFVLVGLGLWKKKRTRSMTSINFDGTEVSSTSEISQ